MSALIGLETNIKLVTNLTWRVANYWALMLHSLNLFFQLYNYFEDNNYVYLVLEICHNGELNRYLKANCKVLSETEARHFMVQIVSGMLYLHSHGILHRDLTLANLLLTKTMDVVSFYMLIKFL